MSGIKWKSYSTFDFDGKPLRRDASSFNKDVTLLQRISNMPKGKPIAIHAAFEMYNHEFLSCLFDEHSIDKAGDIFNQDWVTWVSRQGYQIVLKGNEYDL